MTITAKFADATECTIEIAEASAVRFIPSQGRERSALDDVGVTIDPYTPPALRVLAYEDFLTRFTLLELAAANAVIEADMQAKLWKEAAMSENRVNLDGANMPVMMDKLKTTGVIDDAREQEILA